LRKAYKRGGAAESVLNKLFYQINVSTEKSYAQILKSSSIMGGAAGINLILGMVRTKFAAVLIGTSGIGLLAGFSSIQGIIGTIAGLGIQSSAVREIAGAVGKGDEQAIGRVVLTLRRVCWITGLTGMIAMMALSSFLSQMTFGSDKYTIDIALLGIIILFSNLSGGQMALIQGMRRIGDMARANVFGAAFATVSAIGFYSWLGLRGIVPALVSISGVQLALSWHFARRVTVPTVLLTWKQTFSTSSEMVKLGLVFMWNGLLGSAVTYVTITLITQQIGMHAVGLYSAAFALSGIFVNFVLGAMSADYYPRLTGLAHDKVAVNRLVNEQTEIGLLLAVPGLLVTMAMAPWIIRIFYTSEFLPAVDLLQWFILGCLGRVISWPMGFVMLALGKGRWFFLTETSSNIIHVLLIVLGLFAFGIEGVAVAFFVEYITYTMAVYAVVRYLTGFRWSSEATQMGWLVLPALAVTFLVVKYLPIWPATVSGVLLTVTASFYCLRGLVQRIGLDHRITRIIFKIPGLRLVCMSMNN